jgi:hypothetical protein
MKTFQCANVRIGSESAFTARNLLWRVHGIPFQSAEAESTSRKCDKVLDLPGYLFFNDEEDGFRLTWVVDEWDRNESGCLKDLAKSPFSDGTESSTEDASIITIQKTWVLSCSEQLTGRGQNSDAPSSGLDILLEAFLHVETLLDEILSRRKSVSQRQPEFFYNLISVACRGRVVELVITFITKQRPGSLGVFVRVDLFTGHWQELDFVKSVGVQDFSSLRSWCNALALNRRMRQVRTGPYSIEAKHSIDWGRLCKEFFDQDEEDDFTPAIWKPYVDSTTLSTKKPPKLISLQSLYPDCDLVTNKAVTSKTPVSSIRTRKAPIQLVYG